MERFKVPIPKILGNSYYNYEIWASNNNAIINETIQIYCRMTNVFGKPIKNKELELFMNTKISQGTAITNEEGLATWNITFGQEGVKDFYVENSHCTVLVGGYRQLYNSNGLTWYINTFTGISHISLNRSGINISANNYTVLKSAYSSTDSNVNYCPLTTHMITSNAYDVKFWVSYLGEIRLYNYRSTAISNGQIQANTVFLGKYYRR